MKIFLIVYCLIALTVCQSNTVPLPQTPSDGGGQGQARIDWGTCAGTDCCDLVSFCLCDLAADQNPSQPVQNAVWNAITRCPYPTCAYGYQYDIRTNLCVKYVSGQRALNHTQYTTLFDCLIDYTRASTSHCAYPLEQAWRQCKLGAGFQ